MSWLGFNTFFGWLPNFVKASAPISYISHKFPGLGKEFMPPLDEGAFLYMPTTMPHASIGEVLDVLKKQDMAFTAIPEIESAVGKLGRADTPLDPAPVSMIETVINYKARYKTDINGKRMLFRYDPDETDFVRDEAGEKLQSIDGFPYLVSGKYLRDRNGELIPDSDGHPFSLWRLPLSPELNPGRKRWKGINSPEDIWKEIIRAGKIPGTTSAPKLQPIAARIVMLQSGMRAPMGLKIKGPSLETIEKVGLQIEKLLKEVPSIEPSAVIADRIIGKPYLEIDVNRKAIARYGIMLKKVQDVIEVAIGGKKITTSVEGRERYPVRVRYMRELRNNIESLEKILVPAIGGAQIPLTQLTKINY
ncbi:MAG: efflux RND transporter permease subunit, partial [Candidatus Aminicenantes bacterium]|nr:efflux RND transporter permease subunit [Candidatus Aminicenantes bacterium]